MQSVAKDLSGTNTDKELIDRLPHNDLDMIAAWHLSPKGIKSLLEKMNVLGFANIALARTNMTVDYVLDAFSGDMALCLNNFALNKTKLPADSIMGNGTAISYKPAMSAIYVLKIKNKDNFNRILKMAAENSGITPIDNNTFIIPVSATDSIVVKSSDKYALVTNKSAYAAAFLNGSYKSQSFPADAANALNGHPFSMYFDVQQMVKTINPGSIANNPHDSASISEAKKLLSNISLYGGEFKNNAVEYHVTVNFTDKSENSLLQLMDFGMKVNNQSTLANTTNPANKSVAAN